MTIVYILLAIVILGVIVMAHEFGHFLVGRACGIGVVEFAVGMGPKLIGWKRNGIQYSLRAIPLGGFCSFVGEDATNDDPHAMNRQPVWKRFLTVLAGPFTNFLIAFVIASLLLMTGQIATNQATYHSTLILDVSPDMPAEQAGLRAGDIILAVNGIALSQERSLSAAVQDGGTLECTVQRGGETLSLSILPVYTDTGAQIIGISYRTLYANHHYSLFEAVRTSGALIVDTTVATVTFLRDLIRDLITGASIPDGSVSGAVGIVSTMSEDLGTQFGSSLSNGLQEALYWMMVLSLNLGIMNLLPFPALDGGRLVFLAVEAIRRKPIKPEHEGMVHLIGFAILIIFIIFITVQDVKRLL